MWPALLWFLMSLTLEKKKAADEFAAPLHVILKFLDRHQMHFVAPFFANLGWCFSERHAETTEPRRVPPVRKEKGKVAAAGDDQSALEFLEEAKAKATDASSSGLQLSGGAPSAGSEIEIGGELRENEAP